MRCLSNFLVCACKASTTSPKLLSFNIYDVSYARTEDERQRYIQHIDEVYNADRLADILVKVADIIGATVLNVAKQDYDPQGASVTTLISEHPIDGKASASLASGDR